MKKKTANRRSHSSTPPPFPISNRQELVFRVARSGNYQGIQLTPQDFAFRGENGNTLVHEAGSCDRLEAIPSRWRRLVDKALGMRNADGQTPRDLAAEHREYVKAAARMQLLEQHAYRGGITTLQPTAQELDKRLLLGNTLLHLAAANGRINEIPRRLRTAKRMGRLNSRGVTPAWLARQSQSPYYVPATRLNQQLSEGRPDLTGLSLPLLTFSLHPAGWTLAHSLALHGFLPDLPLALLTFEVLSQKCGRTGRSVYQVFLDRGPDLRLPRSLRVRLDPASARRPRSLDRCFRRQ